MTVRALRNALPRALQRALFVGLFGTALNAHAAEAPIIRVEVTPQTVNVGQAVALRLVVLVPTWFNKPSIYPPFELANAITRLPADSGRPTSERIGNDTWSGVVREYRIYPQLAARYVMTDQVVTVNYANPGAAPVVIEVDVPDIGFRAIVPEGAEALAPFLGGKRVSLDRKIASSLTDLKVGDAVVFTVTATIDGMPAQFLPPLIAKSGTVGVTAYPKEPRLTDGDKATRSETVTWIFQGGGDFSLPPVELDWWNTATKQVETAALAGVPFSVTGAVIQPATVPPDAASVAADPRFFSAMLAGLIVFILAILAWRGRFRIVRWRAARQAARLASESYAFRQLLNATRNDDLQETDRWLGIWLERLDPHASLQQVVERSATPELASQLGGIMHARYSRGDAQDAEPNHAVGLRALGKTLDTCRSGYRRWQQGTRARRVLPPLNPIRALPGSQ
ncbi:MAG: hypothetical protein O7H39_14800 [Gammaproteobacteria bacterium]|nr:hypothetical protein [Gammaproteobacteria bacterium]